MRWFGESINDYPYGIRSSRLFRETYYEVHSYLIPFPLWYKIGLQKSTGSLVFCFYLLTDNAFGDELGNISFYAGHQKDFLRSWYIVCPRWNEYVVPCASVRIVLFISGWLGTQIRFLKGEEAFLAKRKVRVLVWWNFARIFSSWGSCIWAVFKVDSSDGLTNKADIDFRLRVSAATLALPGW